VLAQDDGEDDDEDKQSTGRDGDASQLIGEEAALVSGELAWDYADGCSLSTAPQQLETAAASTPGSRLNRAAGIAPADAVEDRRVGKYRLVTLDFDFVGSDRAVEGAARLAPAGRLLRDV